MKTISREELESCLMVILATLWGLVLAYTLFYGMWLLYIDNIIKPMYNYIVG